MSAVETKQMLAELSQELEHHPELTKEMKAKIMAEAPDMLRKRAESMALDEDTVQEVTAPVSRGEINAGNTTKQMSFSLDTTKFADGSYLIKVAASDRLSNPTGALTGEDASGAFIISNKPPKIMLFKKTAAIGADKSARVEGVAYSNLVTIAGVQYRVGAGDWAAAAPDDGIFDSKFAGFTIVTQPLENGVQTIEVKAIDQAGNSATTKITVRVQ
jgi:hypothetical protein